VVHRHAIERTGEIFAWNGTTQSVLLDTTMNISSFPWLAPTNASAAVTMSLRLFCILPLLSITSPTETGTSSRRNNLRVCSVPFS